MNINGEEESAFFDKGYSATYRELLDSRTIALVQRTKGEIEKIDIKGRRQNSRPRARGR